MSAESAPETDPQLLPILDELAPQEPIFHRAEFASSLADFDRLMVADFWEFGASGRRYDRQFILQKLEKIPPIDAAEAGWHTSDFHCRRLSADSYLLTYTLDQVGPPHPPRHHLAKHAVRLADRLPPGHAHRGRIMRRP